MPSPRQREPSTDFSPLSALCDGEAGLVTAIATDDSMRHRLLDLGLAVGTTIQCLGHSPMGDPAAYRIRGAVIALRAETADQIHIRRTDRKETAWD